MTDIRRTSALTLAFVLAACGTQALVTPPSASPAPSPPGSPSATPSPSPRPTNAASDVLYVRGAVRSAQGGVGSELAIRVLDARTGQARRQLPNGVVSADRALLFSTEYGGGSRTVVHVTDLKTGAEARSVTVDGYFAPSFPSEIGVSPVTPDGRWLALWRQPVQIDGQWVSSYAVVDTTSGTARYTGELKGQGNGYAGLSPDGRDLYLWQIANGDTSLRAFDLSVGTFVDVAGWGRQRMQFRSSFVRHSTRMYAVDTRGDDDRPGILEIDLASRSVRRMPLPAEQGTSDYEKYLLWSVAVTPDGRTLYAVNPAMGVVDEVDLPRMTIRQAARLASSRPESGLIAWLSQLVFPVAEAKRYVRGGAALAPDGGTLYAIGIKGIAVVDARTLTLRSTWVPEAAMGNIALTSDGARLYAVDDSAHSIVILDSRDGSSLGRIDSDGYVSEIVRIDVP